jgi:Serine hydrolase
VAEEVFEGEELIRMGFVEADGEGGPERMSVRADVRASGLEEQEDDQLRPLARIRLEAGLELVKDRPCLGLLPVGIDWNAVAQASAQLPIVITSDNDPYCREGIAGYQSTYTGALDLRHEVIPGAGHFTIEDGFGPWPAMLAWCLNGNAPWSTAADA